MDEVGIVRAVTLAKLREYCGGRDPARWGLVTSDGGLFFGMSAPKKELLVSLADIERAAEEDDELAGLRPEELVMVSWTTSIDPVEIEWHVLSEDDVLAMKQETDEDGTTTVN
jgi:hypothetical protein